MNYLYKKLAQLREQSNNKLVVYTTSSNSLTGGLDKIPLPYHVWQEETKILKLR